MNSGRSLLTAEERVICEQISRQDPGLYGQRARVLLALDEGKTQARAGELAGLTGTEAGQCLASFHQLRTAGIYSEQAQAQEVRSEPKFSSQLGVTDTNIEDSVTHLKQTQSELKKQLAAARPEPEIQENQEPPESRNVSGRTGSEPHPEQRCEDSAQTGTSVKSEKSEKADKKPKLKKTGKKPKKSRKPRKPRKPKNKRPKKHKKRKKKKKQKK